MKAGQSGNFKAVKLPEPQTTVARCVWLVDVGTVPNIYKNKFNGMHHRVYISWELPLLTAVFNEDKGEQPFFISEELTLSTNENSNFAKLISAWRNKPFTPEEQKGFDPKILLGKTALIQFNHRRKAKYRNQEISEVTNENTVLKMQTIMRKPKEMPIPKQINPTLYWDWDIIATEGWNQEDWERIPAFIRTKMKESEEFKRYAPDNIKYEDSGQSENAQTPMPASNSSQSVSEAIDDDF